MEKDKGVVPEKTTQGAVQTDAVDADKKVSMLKKFPGKGKSVKSTALLILGSFLVVLAGVATGWFLSGRVMGEKTEGKVSKETTSKITQTETEAGLDDESLFPDVAEGTLVEGGIEGEGTHHLERPGGISQNVYLTSTVIDLQSFVGKKVKVWGETISGRQAGWLMDVGKVKVVE